jgi:hypothetical protein
MGEKRNVCRLLVGKAEGNRLLGRPRCRWLNNIEMDLGERGWGDVDWTGLVWLEIGTRALINAVMNTRLP